MFAIKCMELLSTCKNLVPLIFEIDCAVCSGYPVKDNAIPKCIRMIPIPCILNCRAGPCIFKLQGMPNLMSLANYAM